MGGPGTGLGEPVRATLALVNRARLMGVEAAGESYPAPNVVPAPGAWLKVLATGRGTGSGPAAGDGTPSAADPAEPGRGAIVGGTVGGGDD